MRKYYTRPCNFYYGNYAKNLVKIKKALPLAGNSNISFDQLEIFQRKIGGSIKSYIYTLNEIKKLNREIKNRVKIDLKSITSKRKSISRLKFDNPHIIGALNITPDSFSDGGKYLALEDALSHSLSLLDHGADIIDVGGESTRPGAEIVDENEEIKRTIPLIKELSNKGVVTSIDSRKSKVISAALEAGAQIVNDVSALTFDKESIEVVKKTGVPVILMHMQGNPQTMQKSPQYTCAPLDIFDYLKERIQFCNNHGIDRSQIIVDPGVGFGKTSEHNIEILNYLTLFHGLGCPILVGFSRKRFISEIGSEASEQERLAGSLGAGLLSLNQGVQFLRVHDVFETKQAISVWNSVIQSV